MSPSGNPASTCSATVFHDPVRDGTGWVHRAQRTPLAQQRRPPHPTCRTALASCRLRLARPVLVPTQGSPRPCARTTSTSRPASSVRRSSRSSSGGLTCLKQRGWRLRAWFPLRCCQRFSLPTIASEPAGRPTTPSPAGRPRRSSRTKRSSRHHPNRS